MVAAGLGLLVSRTLAAPVRPLGIGAVAAALLGVIVFFAVNTALVTAVMVAMGSSLHLPASMLGLIPALTQFGVTFGIAFLLPLGDVVPVRRLLTVTILLQAAAAHLGARGPGQPAVIVARYRPMACNQRSGRAMNVSGDISTSGIDSDAARSAP